MARHGYRSWPEQFRDFLLAAKREHRKTRILRRANLNQTSCSRYVSYCLQNGFLVEREGKYELTGRAEEALTAVNLVFERASELHSAVKRFTMIVRGVASEWNPVPSQSERRVRPRPRFTGVVPETVDSKFGVPARMTFSLPRGDERTVVKSKIGEAAWHPRTPTFISSSLISRLSSEAPSGRQDRFEGPRPGSP
jgi:predicted transcriptional regulator